MGMPTTTPTFNNTLYGRSQTDTRICTTWLIKSNTASNFKTSDIVLFNFIFSLYPQALLF